jgi:hypothetical protein
MGARLFVQAGGSRNAGAWEDSAAALDPPPAHAAGEAGETVTLDPMSVRPASIRRHRRMEALIAEFSERDMDCAGVALFLNCSPSAARTYLNALLEASIIRSGRVPRDGYRLNGDPWLIHNFLADLSASCWRRMDLKRGSKPATQARSYGSRHFHIIADDQFVGVKATHVAVRRDPLVEALFGKETTRKNALS